LIVFLAELNALELWGADIGNAYLEALTKEKVNIIGGPEFVDLTGHILLIFKALYGLQSSGLCWHQRFADVLRSMGLIESKAKTDIWMRENNGLYEYIAVYVDDLLIAARDPGEVTRTLENAHKFMPRVSVHLLTIWDVTTFVKKMALYVMVPASTV
jgi:Reverse transcriptase (RNA-dependent DNA polymerase)